VGEPQARALAAAIRNLPGVELPSVHQGAP
jgi:hypothetical protein